MEGETPKRQNLQQIEQGVSKRVKLNRISRTEALKIRTVKWNGC